MDGLVEDYFVDVDYFGCDFDVFVVMGEFEVFFEG